MGKKIVVGVILLVFLAIAGYPVIASENWSQNGDDSLAGAAFAEGDVNVAVRFLLEKQVPLPVIIRNAVNSGVSQNELVSALLAAGIVRETVILQMVQSPLYFGTALEALNANGISAREIFILLVQKNMDIERIVDAGQFMLRQGYSKAEVLKALSAAKAERVVVVQVVQRLQIPPATVVSAYQPEVQQMRGIGHLFIRQTLPQPAWLILGMSHIGPSDAFKDPRKIISPSRP